MVILVVFGGDTCKLHANTHSGICIGRQLLEKKLKQESAEQI